MRPPADFNGDGYGDLAVSENMPMVGDEAGAGAGLVQVLYGSPSGFRPQASQQWSRSDFGGGPGPNSFGYAITHGDLDDDGFSDLVVSDPQITSKDPGDLQVLYGSADGLSRARSQRWSLDSPEVPGTAEAGDRFGSSLAVGDLGRTRHDDLVIGIAQRGGGGAVLVLYGGPRGVTADGSRLWDQHTRGIPGRPAPDGGFGHAVVVGDFDGDRHNELVIGAPYDRVEGVDGAGSVYVLRGSENGPTVEGIQHWTPGRNGVRGHPTEGAQFGLTFAAGRFTGRDQLDLAIGSPGWSSVDTGSAGAVHILYGGDGGLTARNDQQWTEYDVGTREPRDDYPEDHPNFGESLVAADFGRGSADDLVIGVPGAVGPGYDSGAVQIIYGTPTGLTPAHTRHLNQISPGIKGHDQDETAFGAALSVLAATEPEGYPTLLVGAPLYGGLDEFDRSGVVHLIRGSTTGLTAAGDELLSAARLSPQTVGEQFGWRLTS
ncbi:MAG: FG-GAP repeat protein [Propionibacteriaceae bacterium]